MHGTINFPTLDDLVEFLTLWTGKSTATFTVRLECGIWILAFEGGY